MDNELDVGKEIDEMLDGIGSAKVEEEDAEVKAIEGEGGEDDDSETDEEGEESEERSEEEEDTGIEDEEDDKGDKEEEEEDIEEEIEEEEIEDDTPSIEDLLEQNRILMKRVEELSVEKPAVEADEEEVKDVLKDFLKDGEDIDDVVSDPKHFGEVLNRVKAQAVLEAKEEMMGAIPPYVIDQIHQQKVLGEAIEEFYVANEDLRSVRRTVGAITGEVVAEHSDWELGKIFDEVAKRTRNMLGIKTKGAKKTKKLRKPALRKKTRSSRSKPSSPKMTDVEKDIQETLF